MRASTRLDLAPRRIAVFRALYLGDLLLSIPALRSLRAAYPMAEITLIGLPWAADFIRRYPYVNRFLEFPGFPGLPEREVDDIRTQTFLRHARKYRYGLAIQMHGSGIISNRFVAGLGAGHSVGFVPDPAAESPVDEALIYRESEHEIHKWLRVAHLAGATGNDPQLEFPLTDTDRREARDLAVANGFRLGDQYIIFHVGAKHPARRWPAERWARVADELSDALAAPSIFVGSEHERLLIHEVTRRMRSPGVSLAGKTSLGGLAALLAQATMFVGGDSGPAHLAEAVGTKTVRLFGPTDPARWGPLDVANHRVVQSSVTCTPCQHTECPGDHRCLASVTVAAVVAEALRLMVFNDEGRQMRR